MTGKINDIIVLVINKPPLDKELIDGQRVLRKLIRHEPETLRFKTKSGAQHYYSKYGAEICCTSKEIDGHTIDILSNGDYVEVCDIARSIFSADDDDEPAPIQPMPKEEKKQKEKKTKTKKGNTNNYPTKYNV